MPQRNSLLHLLSHCWFFCVNAKVSLKSPYYLYFLFDYILYSMAFSPSEINSLKILVQYRERVIFIGQNIDEEFSNQVLATMLYLDSVESSKKIYLYINGPGGDVSSLFSTSCPNFCCCSCLLNSASIVILSETFLLLFVAHPKHGYLWHNAKLEKSCCYTLCGLCLQFGRLSSCCWRKGIRIA